MDKQEYYLQEIEALNGQFIRGDLTPVVLDLLKDTPHKKELIAFLNKENSIDVSSNESNKTLREEDNLRPCFEKWFSGFEQL